MFCGYVLEVAREWTGTSQDDIAAQCTDKHADMSPRNVEGFKLYPIEQVCTRES